MPAARPSRSVIRNAIQAAQDCGLTVAEVIPCADGSVRIVAAQEDERLPSRGGDQEWPDIDETFAARSG